MDKLEKKRFEHQTRAIIGRLEKGPAFNYELAKISLKYTSRISDARKLGHWIDCERRVEGQNRSVTRYTLHKPVTTPMDGNGMKDGDYLLYGDGDVKIMRPVVAGAIPSEEAK